MRDDDFPTMAQCDAENRSHPHEVIAAAAALRANHD